MDNKSAIDLAYNPEHHQHSKHINRRHFFLRERVETNNITLPFVNSTANLADFLTKALTPRLALMLAPGLLAGGTSHRFTLRVITYSFRIFTPSLVHAAAHARTHATERRPRPAAALAPARRPELDGTRGPPAS
eukprot:2639420-Pleurochrysis_carterae.AAC.1